MECIGGRLGGFHHGTVCGHTSRSGGAVEWFRLQAAWSSPQGDFREVDGDEVITADFTDSFGFGLQIERMVSNRIGIELGVIWNEPDVNVVIEEPPVRLRIEAPLRFTPVILGVNYHLGSGGKTDFYFGPALAYIFYDDLVLSDPDFGRETLTVDDDYAWGLTLGGRHQHVQVGPLGLQQ